MNFIKGISHKQALDCYYLDLKTLKMWSLQQWETELKKKEVKTLGIYDEKLIIGICTYQIILDEVEISYLSIHPNHEKKGLGTYLINRLFEECYENNISKIFLEVSVKNKVAINFYKKSGFKTIGLRKNYYKDGSDAILKEKKLLKK